MPNSMDNFGVQLLVSFIGSIPALLFALWVERQRMPKLEIVASKEANVDITNSLYHHSVSDANVPRGIIVLIHP